MEEGLSAQHPHERETGHALLRQFILAYIPVALVLTITLWVSATLRAELHLTSYQTAEQARVDIARGLIDQDFDVVASDLKILANMLVLKRFLDSGGTAEYQQLSRQLLEVAKTTDRYDQIRYLDERGREVVRINYNNGHPYEVPRGELQNKAGRYYFNDALKLGRGEMFVSPLDLNVEHDRIEMPFKPMIRFGMPVFDSVGNKRGIVLLNYFGDGLLGHFREAMGAGQRYRAMLLNSDGYWLSSDKPEDVWGFMFGKHERTFGHDFPQEWQRIRRDERGSLMTDRGLFVFDTVYPLRDGAWSSSGTASPNAASQHTLRAHDYFWKIVGYTPTEVLAAQESYLRSDNLLLIVVLYLLSAAGAYTFAKLQLGRKRARLALQLSEKRLREITGTMSDGLIVMDRNGRIEFANLAATRLLGYVPEEMIGQDMHELLHVTQDGTPAPRAECKVSRVLQDGQSYRGDEEYFRTKSGAVLAVASSASAIIRNGGVDGVVVAFQDISPRKSMERELEYRAHIDALTGLPNRRHFFELAEQELARSLRYDKPLSMLMLDVDYFKRINDVYGHHVGDMVLQKLGDLCGKTLREMDIPGRLGGEEFAFLLPETALEQAREVAERLRQAVAEAGLAQPVVEDLDCTVSIGVAQLVHTDADITDLLKRADKALYAAKHAGRNRVYCAD